MPDIVTITFSPCIDKYTSVSRLLPDKKLRCNQPSLKPGGGGINIARAIINLGGRAKAIYPAGGYTGNHFMKLMKEEKVPSIVIPTRNDTRENIIVLDEYSNRQYRFGMPCTPLFVREWKNCLAAIKAGPASKYIVVSGSIAPGVPADIFNRLSIIARKMNARLIVDAPGKDLARISGKGILPDKTKYW